jgi:SAM-dependent methyltransferase
MDKLYKPPFDSDKFLDETFHRNCPVCGSNTLRHKPFETFIENRHLYSVRICDECGFVFQNPIYDKEHYHSLPCSYPRNYLKHSYNRARYILELCRDYLKDKRKISVLDIGAGKGGVVYYIEQLRLGAICYGVTLEEERIDKVWDSNLALRMTNFDFETDFVWNQTFDFIIMAHVLEHFIDPSKAIQIVRKLLKDDGILYIEVPSLYFTEYRTKSVWTPEHLSYFTEISLFNLLNKNGFRLLKFNNSKIWGNIKTIYQKDYNGERKPTSKDFNVIEIYNSNKIKKFIQRMKHKLGFKYEASV